MLDDSQMALELKELAGRVGKRISRRGRALERCPKNLRRRRMPRDCQAS